MNFKLLPSESFTIQTQDSINVVRQKLLVEVEDSNTIRSTQDHADFKGQVTDHGFKISRSINYKNVFLPIICGRFEDIPSGTTIHVSVELNSLITRIYINFYLSMLIMSILKLLADLGVTIISSSVSLSLKSISSELLGILMISSFFIILLIKRIFKNSFRNEVKFGMKKLTQIFLGQFLSEDNEIVFY